MPIHYKNIAISNSLVIRDVDALEGISLSVPHSTSGTGMAAYNHPGGSTNASSNVKPGKWININHATNRHWWGNVFEVTNDSITAGGTSVPRPWKYLRLFAYGSFDRTYSAVIINHPLQPGEQIEISFYASQGANLTDTGSSSVSGGSATSNSASEDQDIAMQVLYSTSVGSSNNINSLNDFIRHPFSNTSNGMLRSSASGGRTATVGDGDILAANGSNVGAINGGWRYADSRESSSYTQADFTARSGDESKIGRLYAENVPDESGGGYTRFFEITIRNDTDLPAYLKLKPYNWNSTYEYYTFFDFRIKVTSSRMTSTLGGHNDITHIRHALSPRIEKTPNPHTDSGEESVDMLGRHFVNIGDPWPQPTWDSPNFTPRGTWSNRGGSGAFSSEIPLNSRNQLVSKKFYDAWSTYHTPVIVSFAGRTHTNVKQWIELTGMETSANFTGNTDQDPELYVTRGVMRLMPFSGRLHSVTIQTQEPGNQIITARLYKKTGNLPRQDGSVVYDTSASISEIGSIVFDKADGIRGTDEEPVTQFLKHSEASNGAFTAGEVLMMRIDAGTASLGAISGTIVFLRGDM